MDKFKQWLRAKYKIGGISDKQLQVLYESAGLSRSLLLRWVYDDYQLSETESELLMAKAIELSKNKGL